MKLFPMIHTDLFSEALNNKQKEILNTDESEINNDNVRSKPSKNWRNGLREIKNLTYMFNNLIPSSGI